MTVRQRKESVHSDGGDTDNSLSQHSLNECYDNDFGSSEETSEGKDQVGYSFAILTPCGRQCCMQYYSFFVCYCFVV